MTVKQDKLNKALLEAAEAGNLAKVKKFIRAGADVDASDSAEEMHPLHLAAKNGHLPVVKCLLENGAKVDARCFFGRQAIHKAADAGHLFVVRQLVSHGAKVDAEDELHGCQPLHYAASSNRVSVMRFLIGKGARIDVADDGGWTPLHYAQHLAAAKFLLEEGGDPMAKDEKGRTPLDLAEDPDNMTSPMVRDILKKWSAPGFLEKRRQEDNAKAVRDHWKKVGRRIAPAPRI